MTASTERSDRPEEHDDAPIADPVAPPEGTDPSQPEETATAESDPGRSIRTWFWMLLVAGFGLFLVFGSVQAHYWRRDVLGNARPVRRGVDVLDVWRAQVNGLPDVAHQTVLKSVFLASVFGFIGLSVVALWLATVVIRAEFPTPSSDPAIDDGQGAAAGPAAG